jgi:hypothetical protein
MANAAHAPFWDAATFKPAPPGVLREHLGPLAAARLELSPELPRDLDKRDLLNSTAKPARWTVGVGAAAGSLVAALRAPRPLPRSTGSC